MKIACITDLHFGNRQNSDIFLERMSDCFRQFLIYAGERSDTIVIGGDVFDSRTAINVKVANYVYRLFKEMDSLSIPVYVILGNHDVYYNTSNEFNSLKMLKGQFDNITIVEKISVIEKATSVGSGGILLVPWVVDRDKFVDDVASGVYPQEICFGHFNINGFPMYRNSILSDSGIPAEVMLKSFKLTLSGHFHTRSVQHIDNMGKIAYIGAPWQLTRNDRDDDRGFVMLDTETLETEFINMDQGIKFKEVCYPDTPDQKEVAGNIVDLYIDYSQKFNEKDLQKYIDELQAMKPAFPPEIRIVNKLDMDVNEELAKTKFGSTIDLMKGYIDDQNIEEKEKINSLMVELYQESGGD